MAFILKGLQLHLKNAKLRLIFKIVKENLVNFLTNSNLKLLLFLLNIFTDTCTQILTLIAMIKTD